MNNSATFAVIVPVHNGERFVNECLNSVLSQSRVPDEVIFVDDGSTDKTWNIVSDLCRTNAIVKAVRTRKKGVSAARNLGASLATSSYLFFLDVDDRWLPGKVSAHEQHFSKHAECNFSFSLSRIFKENPNTIVKIDTSQLKSPSLFNVLLHEFQILGSSSSVCLKREFFWTAGGFKLELNRGEDWELWVRCTQLIEPCQLNEVLVSICLRNDSVEQSSLRGIDNFYSTALHLTVWSNYKDEVASEHFSKLAIRILFADIWKNRFKIIFNWHKYDKLFLSKGIALLPLLNLKGKRHFAFKILLLYLQNRRRFFD